MYIITMGNFDLKTLMKSYFKLTGSFRLSYRTDFVLIFRYDIKFINLTFV